MYVGIGNYRRAESFHNRSKRWRDYVATHGKPRVEIIHEGLTQDEAIAIETDLVARYGRAGIDPMGVLMNVSVGGRGRFKRTAEHVEKVQAAKRCHPISDKARENVRRAAQVRSARLTDEQRSSRMECMRQANIARYARKLADAGITIEQARDRKRIYRRDAERARRARVAPAKSEAMMSYAPTLAKTSTQGS
jgi:hypothetical protein